MAKFHERNASAAWSAATFATRQRPLYGARAAHGAACGAVAEVLGNTREHEVKSRLLSGKLTLLRGKNLHLPGLKMMMFNFQLGFAGG